MQKLTSIALSSLVAVSFAGCGDNAAPDPVAVDPQTFAQTPIAQAPTSVPFPASCLDAGNGAVVADGTYTLYVGGDDKKPWQAYCHGGNEYLSVNDYTNYGQYSAGGYAVGTDVTTWYSKLRIDPQTLTLDISDQTFAHSDGMLDNGSDHITSMPLGVAMSCAGSLTYGTAGMDLLGTPFRIVSTWTLATTSTGAAAPSGHETLFRDGQWMEAWAQGECGYSAPSAIAGTPINKPANGWTIKLEWFVPTP